MKIGDWGMGWSLMNTLVFVCVDSLREALSLRWRQQPAAFLFLSHSNFSFFLCFFNQTNSLHNNMYAISFHFSSLLPFCSFQLILPFGFFHSYPYSYPICFPSICLFKLFCFLVIHYFHIIQYLQTYLYNIYHQIVSTWVCIW